MTRDDLRRAVVHPLSGRRISLLTLFPLYRHAPRHCDHTFEADE